MKITNSFLVLQAGKAVYKSILFTLQPIGITRLS